MSRPRKEGLMDIGVPRRVIIVEPEPVAAPARRELEPEPANAPEPPGREDAPAPVPAGAGL
ncbi:MAG: hypothetical protein WD184_03015 [Acidimicrobiia bacterium]